MFELETEWQKIDILFNKAPRCQKNKKQYKNGDDKLD